MSSEKCYVFDPICRNCYWNTLFSCQIYSGERYSRQSPRIRWMHKSVLVWYFLLRKFPTNWELQIPVAAHPQLGLISNRTYNQKRARWRVLALLGGTDYLSQMMEREWENHYYYSVCSQASQRKLCTSFLILKRQCHDRSEQYDLDGSQAILKADKLSHLGSC